jgi:hypothetical protein
MTVEEAIQILHPETTAETINRMRMVNMSDEEILDKVNEACVLACEIMKKHLKENDANAN